MRTRLKTRSDLKEWLNRLDSYTNAEFGHAFTICEPQKICVACGLTFAATDVCGLCEECSAKRRPDDSAIVFFKPLHRRPQ